MCIGVGEQCTREGEVLLREGKVDAEWQPETDAHRRIAGWIRLAACLDGEVSVERCECA